MKNYFQILNVTEDAEKEVIIASYKALAKKYHPDSSNYDERTSAAKMALINEAYEVLSDDVKRRAYLELLKESSYKSESYDSETKWEWEDDYHDHDDDENGSAGYCNRNDVDNSSAEFGKETSAAMMRNQQNAEVGEGLLYRLIKIIVIAAIVISLLASFIHFGIGGMVESKNTFSQFAEDILYNFHLK